MIILDVPGRARVVVLGQGQIGSAVVDALLASEARVVSAAATDWSTPDSAAETTVDALERIARTSLPVVVLWAAGAAGMTSSEEYCERSLSTMRDVLGAVRELPSCRPTSVHIIGSAGACALGQPRWGLRSGPAGRSTVPYVRLKLDEEEYVRSFDDWHSIVHRVTSVYGPPGRPGRSGMVTVLVRNACQNRATSIYGGWSTLRNYVHADDVAASVAESMLAAGRSEIRVLAAPRSHAISELVRLVADARRRPVPIRLLRSENAEDLTIDPGTVAHSFRSRPLHVAVRQMVLELRHDPATVAS